MFKLLFKILFSIIFAVPANYILSHFDTLVLHHVECNLVSQEHINWKEQSNINTSLVRDPGGDPCRLISIVEFSIVINVTGEKPRGGGSPKLSISLDVSLMNRTVDLMALLNWQNFRSSPVLPATALQVTETAIR